jgi:iron(III) transport system ATP-binding protein
MSDTIAVMNNGRIVQLGSPRDIYFRPANAFVARFVGATNLLSGTVVQRNESNVGMVKLPGDIIVRSVLPPATAAGQQIGVSIRPESISVASATDLAGPESNVMSGKVVLTSFLGNMNRLEVDCGTFSVQVNTGPQIQAEIGSPIHLRFPVSDTLATPLD